MRVQSAVLASRHEDEEKADHRDEDSPLSHVHYKIAKPIERDGHNDDGRQDDDAEDAEGLGTAVATAATRLVKLCVVHARWNLDLFEYDVTHFILSKVLAEVIVVDHEVFVGFALGLLLLRGVVIVHVIDTEVDDEVVLFLASFGVCRRTEEFALFAFV